MWQLVHLGAFCLWLSIESLERTKAACQEQSWWLKFIEIFPFTPSHLIGFTRLLSVSSLGGSKVNESTSSGNSQGCFSPPPSLAGFPLSPKLHALFLGSVELMQGEESVFVFITFGWFTAQGRQFWRWPNVKFDTENCSEGKARKASTPGSTTSPSCHSNTYWTQTCVCVSRVSSVLTTA